MILTITGPFDTLATMAVPARAMYWSAVVLYSIITVESFKYLARKLRPDWPEELNELASVAAFSAVGGPVIWAMTVTSIPDPNNRLATLYPLWAQIAAISLGVALLRILIIRALQTAPQAEVLAEEPTLPRPRLFNRVEGTTRNDRIVRLSGDDHYVLVIFANGREERVLMRLIDAIAEMDGITGHCTHRSHWVTRDWASYGFRFNGRDYLRLRDGGSLPVTRKYKPGLEEAGFTFQAGQEEPERIAAQ